MSFYDICIYKDICKSLSNVIGTITVTDDTVSITSDILNPNIKPFIMIEALSLVQLRRLRLLIARNNKYVGYEFSPMLDRIELAINSY